MALPLAPRTLKGQLILAHLVLILASVGGLAGWIAPRLSQYAEEQAEHQLEIESHIIAAALRETFEDEKNSSPILRARLDTYAASSQARITVVDRNLRVLASSEPRISDGHEENHPEFIAARAGGEQHDIRWDEYTNEERLFTAAPILDDHGQPLGFVQLSVPMLPIRNGVYQSWLALFGVVLLITSLTVATSLWLAREVAAPLEKLTALAEAIAGGDLKQRAPLRGPQEVQRLAEAFNYMTARLEQIIQRQQEFVANAAHELRSPLTALRLRLELTLTRLEDEPHTQRQYLEQMMSEIDRLRTMTNQLLLLSSLDEGNRLPPTPTDLAPLLYEVCEELTPLIHAAGQKLEVNVPPHLPPVNVNPEQVRIIIRNLLDNANKYTPPAGQITLTAEVRGQSLAISVGDNGPGISADTLPFIFERFYRGDKSRKRTARSSSGLGLALVRELTELNHGTISVQSAPGQGSIFTVTFPLLGDR